MRVLRTGLRLATLRAPRIAAPPPSAWVPDYYISPTGSALNSGTSASPKSMASFLSGMGGIVQPSIKIGALGGDYIGQYIGGSAISGTPGSLVTLRQVPGERATLDGNVGVSSTANSIFRNDANYVRLWDLEIVNTDPIRQSATAGSNPSDMNHRSFKNLRNTGIGNEYINLDIHDTANGIEDQSQDTAWLTLIYGCRIRNVGWFCTLDRGHGHSIYLQNANALGKIVKNTICWGSFDINVQFSGDAASMLYITSDGLVLFNCGHDGINQSPQVRLLHDGILSGSSAHRRAHLWGPVGGPLRFGNAGVDNPSPIELTDSYVVGQPGFNENQGYNSQRNTFVQYALGGKKVVALRRPAGQPYSDHTFDFNEIYGLDSDQPFYDVLNGAGTTRTFAGWKTSSGNLYDQHSTFTSATKPTVSRVFFQTNDYEARRGHYICYNWSGAATLPLDLALAGFQVGETYKIWHVYSDWYDVPDYTGTYSGSLVDVATGGWVPPDYIGLPGVHCDSPGPEFNVFLLRKG